jgi:hypothetical protein
MGNRTIVQPEKSRSNRHIPPIIFTMELLIKDLTFKPTIGIGDLSHELIKFYLKESEMRIADNLVYTHLK